MQRLACAIILLAFAQLAAGATRMTGESLVLPKTEPTKLLHTNARKHRRDRIFASRATSSSDTMHGSRGDDHFFTRNDGVDQLFGGAGRDSAVRDDEDVLKGIETPV